MLEAFLWGLVASLSLVIGGIIASAASIRERGLGLIMAFGGGVLISAVAYELVFEAVRNARMTGFPTLGLFAGATTFFICDKLISDRVIRQDSAGYRNTASGLVVPMVLAIVLDGIPESVAIGLGILDGGGVSLAMLTAVFVSNVPEAIAATTGMRSSDWKAGKILGLWSFIALLCSAASGAGYAMLSAVSPQWMAFVQTFAAGAILTMLGNSMIPESYEYSGKFAGLMIVLGFSVAVAIAVLEHAATS